MGVVQWVIVQGEYASLWALGYNGLFLQERGALERRSEGRAYETVHFRARCSRFGRRLDG